MHGPNPDVLNPLEHAKNICFIKNAITNPNIICGDFSYFDDDLGERSFDKNVLYLYPFSKDKLIIGKFCAFAGGVRFIMNSANHRLSGLSTYPFEIFEGFREKGEEISTKGFPFKGDTQIGNDVWLGYKSLIMPGVKIGNGSIIAAKSVVSKNIEPYSIVGGNPAKTIKLRFDDKTISVLEKIKWWDWSTDFIYKSRKLITEGNINKLYHFYEEHVLNAK